MLRPWGGSPAGQLKKEPKLEFQRDYDGKWPWRQGLQIREIIFPVNGLDDSDQARCPVAKPNNEPNRVRPLRSQTRKTVQPTYQPSPPQNNDQDSNPFEWFWPLIRLITGGERA